MLVTLAFSLIMFTPWIMSDFYLILFPAGFSTIHPGHEKTARDQSSPQNSPRQSAIAEDIAEANSV